MTRCRGAGALLAAGCLVLAGCSAPGPLTFSADENRVCAPVDRYPHVALGVSLPDDLPGEIEIESVEIINPVDVIVGELSLMPVRSRTRLLMDAYPPVAQFPDAWPHATSALGGRLVPGETQDLVIEITAGAEGGSLDGERIIYRYAGARYEAVVNMGLTLSTTPCV